MLWFDQLKPITQKVHVKHRALRKCCGCLHLRAGAMIASIVWFGLSLYFTCLSFMNKSPFYSYLNQAAAIVWGVMNLIFTLISLVGVWVGFLNEPVKIRPYSHAVWLMIFLMLTDGIVNVIVFIINKRDYMLWCYGDSQRSMNSIIESAFPNETAITVVFNTDGDLYNCNRMWGDELKFSLLSMIIIFVCYIYWAACIWSYSHKRAAQEQNKKLEATMKAQQPKVVLPTPAVAPVAAVPGLVGPHVTNVPQGVGAGRGGGGGANIIVLQNEKPSRKSRRFSTSLDSPFADPGVGGYNKKGKKPMFGFKGGNDSGFRELENDYDFDMELGYVTASAHNGSAIGTENLVVDMRGVFDDPEFEDDESYIYESDSEIRPDGGIR